LFITAGGGCRLVGSDMGGAWAALSCAAQCVRVVLVSRLDRLHRHHSSGGDGALVAGATHIRNGVMAIINFPLDLYLPQYEAFARPIVVTPVASQPGAPSYSARGIFDTEKTVVETLDGALYSDTKTILDILEPEFATLPRQGDLVSIPLHADVRGGEFIVSDLSVEGNAGGETTLGLRRITPSQLVGGALVLRAPTFARPRLRASL